MLEELVRGNVTVTATVTVNFQALTDLVAYLERQSDQQRQINALAAEVTALTGRLQQSNVGLQGAEAAEVR